MKTGKTMRRALSLLCSVAMLASLLPVLPAAAAEPAFSDNFESYELNSRFSSDVYTAQDLPEGGIASRTIKEEGGNQYLLFSTTNTEESTGRIRNRINTTMQFEETFTVEWDYKNIGDKFARFDTYVRTGGNIRVTVSDDGTLYIRVLDAVKVEGVMETVQAEQPLETNRWYTFKTSMSDEDMTVEVFDKENNNALVATLHIPQDTSTAPKLTNAYYIWFDMWGAEELENTDPMMVALDNLNITNEAYDGLVNSAYTVGTSTPSTPAEPEKPAEPSTPAQPSNPGNFEEGGNADAWFDGIGTGDYEHECPSSKMLDVRRNTWFHQAVDYALDNGLMSGYNIALFGPNDTLTRAMVVQVLYNKEGQPSVDVANMFTDVPANQWFYNAVRWGADKGVVSGFGNGQFRPEDAVTLEQVAVILWNYAGNPAFTGTADSVGAHSSWASNALAWALENGILKNMPYEAVTDAATRAQTAQMLMNYLK